MIFNTKNIILPEPGNIAKEHSSKLQIYIADLIQKSPNKWISFKNYMQAALYTPNLGYYVAGLEKLGYAGDFITAPEISPLFGYTIANSLSLIIQENPNFNILEFGAGSGKLAYDILSRLNTLKTLPCNYYILDVSPDLKQKQKNLFKQLSKNIKDKIIFLSSLPENFDGIILANEVIDAMPVNLFEIDFTNKNNIAEIGVSLNSQVINKEQKIIFNKNQHIDSKFKDYINNKILPNIDRQELKKKNITKYLIEYNYQAELWIDTISKILNSGLIYIIDYGFNKKEYYHQDRHQGTLQCHYQHHSNSEPLWYPGLQDITTHVDFNNIAEIAFNNSCDIEAYISQGHFLILNNIQNFINDIDISENAKLKLSQDIKKLTMPHEMGDLFKFLIISKNLNKEYFINLDMFNKKYIL
tara:strand:+ start:7835 stop:9073 length:1239 start_codon:yes stop_codon:yes gene_type:complete